jgi:hypothetical protein
LARLVDMVRGKLVGPKGEGGPIVFGSWGLSSSTGSNIWGLPFDAWGGGLKKRRPKISPFRRGVLGIKESLLGGTLGPIRASVPNAASGHMQQLI